LEEEKNQINILDIDPVLCICFVVRRLGTFGVKVKGTQKEKERHENIIKGFCGGLHKDGVVRYDNNYIPRKNSKMMKYHIHMPFVEHLDGLSVWLNETFGKKEPGLTLDAVSEKYLVCTSTTIPMRKIQMDVTQGLNYWKASGEKCRLLLSYCMVDALLPILLLDQLSSPCKFKITIKFKMIFI